MPEPTWTVEDQARADAFTEQIVAIAAQLQGGHPDAIVLAFVQTTGSLMRDRLRADPTRGPFYARMIEMLATHVAQAMPPAAADGTRH
jgi:hypothetical protein